jgi:hypothetical protein
VRPRDDRRASPRIPQDPARVGVHPMPEPGPGSESAT